jgi:copper chaperone CopZ
MIIKVNDMHCKHCVKTIKGALKKNKIKAKVSLDNKSVDVAESVYENAINVIKECGFQEIS